MFAGVSLAPNFCYAFWPADWALNASLDTMLKELKESIKRAAIAALKEEAARTINETVNNAIYQGTGTGAMFITNWEDFLINEPQRKADIYINDLISNSYKGREMYNYVSSSSSSGFFSSANGNQKVAGASAMREGVIKGVSSSSTSGSDIGIVMENVKKRIFDTSIQACPLTNLSGAYTKSNWIDFEISISTPTCTEIGAYQVFKPIQLSRLEQEAKMSSDQAIAGQGYRPAMSGNTVITPAITIAAIKAQAEDIGNKIIASANSIPEVITALVTRMAVKTIQQGIGQAGSYARREINSKVNNVAREVRSATDPRQIFKPSY